MPKLKTKRSAAKRFSFTATGKIKRNNAYHRHNLTDKPKTAKVGHRQGDLVASADERMVRRMLPYR
jgi:large subunit ribosomal protein L35